MALVAKRDIIAGEQLEISYGALSNDFLLLDYGFTVSGNPHDRVSLRFGFELLQVGCRTQRQAISIWAVTFHEALMSGAAVISELQVPAAASMPAGSICAELPASHTVRLGLRMCQQATASSLTPWGLQAAQLEVRQAAGLQAGGLQDLPPWQAQRMGHLFQQAGPETTLSRPALPAWSRGLGV